MMLVGSRIVCSYTKGEVAKHIGMITIAKDHLISSVNKLYRFQKPKSISHLLSNASISRWSNGYTLDLVSDCTCT